MKLETLSAPPSPEEVTPTEPPGAADAARPGVSRRTVTLVIVFLLLAAGWTGFSQVTGFGFIAIDDPSYVFANQFVQKGLTAASVKWAFTSLEFANWHPLTWLSLMADYELYGLNAGGYHLTNLLLHEAATLLLFGWLMLATRRLGASAGVALLFCIHPMHVESVAWVTERKDVLSTVFLFLLLIAWTRYAQTRRPAFYRAAFIAMVFGLLAKPMLVTVPPLLLLLDAWPLDRLRLLREFPALLREKTPFILVSIASCVITFIAQHGSGATVPLTSVPIWVRLFSTVRAYAAYVGKLCWPTRLGVYYPYQISISPGYVIACAAALLAATAGAMYLYRSRRYVLVGWLWFLGTLVPVIGLVQVGGQAMADRYTYVPSIGLFIVVCWTLDAAWQAFPRMRLALAGGSAVVLAACLTLCCRQVEYWRSDSVLLRHNLAIVEPDFNSYYLLGDFYASLHCWPETAIAYREAFKLHRNDVRIVAKLGNAELQSGNWIQAHAWLQQLASRPSCHDPEVFANLGDTLIHLGLARDACAPLRRSIELNPKSAAAHALLGDALGASGDTEAATAAYERALALNERTPATLASLAWLYAFAQHDKFPDRAARALPLAQEAASESDRENIAVLDALAAAQAALGNWPRAVIAASDAVLACAGQSASPEQFLIHQERLAHYWVGQWPSR